MEAPGEPSALEADRHYKVKLASGRILGPLTLFKIRQFILKDQITGLEQAREYPQGDWQDINQFPEIAELLVAKVSGALEAEGEVAPDKATEGATTILPGAGAAQTLVLGTLPELPEGGEASASAEPPPPPPEEDKTIVGSLSEDSGSEDDDRTRVEVEAAPVPVEAPKVEGGGALEFEEELPVPAFEPARNIAAERTVVFQRSSESSTLPGKKRNTPKDIIRALATSIALGIAGYYLLLDEPPKGPVTRLQPVRPMLPSYVQGKSDSKRSMQIYTEAMKFYLADTVQGYKMAADRLRQAAGYDITNVKALAMLASSYINLIDSSNKDENYFFVLSKLIDMSRAKSVDLPETVIADVEFFIVVNKAEAAENRIVEYTKIHPNYGIEMFYYLAFAFYSRGDAATAARYLAQFPDNKAFSAKIFYLKGLVAEKLRDPEEAMRQYKRAVQFNTQHAKSRLKIAEIMAKQGLLKEAAPNIEFLINNPHLLTPDELASAYYLHTQVAELFQKFDIALGDIERAVKLDPENHDYLLELYTLRAKAGESLQAVQKQARMYFFLGEGEKLIQQGKYQEAMVPLLQAREANDASPIPPVKIGDMFNYLHDVQNARMNYKVAADRAPNNIQVWSKYIQSLIQSYEWEEATKAMDRFRKLPVSQSAIDKAAADMYQKQGRFIEAQVLYKKAMARESIDPDVYIAYAKSLMSTRNYKDAPFFFALALRFDPLNIEAVINTAKCVAETESIDRGISLLQDELKQGNSARAEFLCAIAELQIQKGAWDEAQQTLDQAMAANQDYAYSWKIQAQIHMNRENMDKTALNKALAAYKSFSDRNASDPSGYLERYKIFIKKFQFEEAKEELNRIYEIYPRYPNLHYFLGALYSVQGNHRAAADEFKKELSNNPVNAPTQVAYGKELLELNQVQDALNYFTKAMLLQPENADAKQNAGWANYRLKNYQAAISLIRAALLIDKANPVLYKRLGQVNQEAGDPGGACNAFRKYLEMEPDASDKADFQHCF